MREQQYKNMLCWMKSHKTFASLTLFLGKFITYIVYAFYPLFIAFLIITQNSAVYRCVIVPAVSFVLLSLIRYFLNLPRPYEKFELTPLYNKSTQGKSFPSRHTFSIFIIAVASYYIFPILGIIIALLGVILAINRVLCGVHFIRDVLAGIFFGLGAGWLGFYII